MFQRRALVVISYTGVNTGSWSRRVGDRVSYYIRSTETLSLCHAVYTAWAICLMAASHCSKDTFRWKDPEQIGQMPDIPGHHGTNRQSYVIPHNVKWMRRSKPWYNYLELLSLIKRINWSCARIGLSVLCKNDDMILLHVEMLVSLRPVLLQAGGRDNRRDEGGWR